MGFSKVLFLTSIPSNVGLSVPTVSKLPPLRQQVGCGVGSVDLGPSLVLPVTSYLAETT